MIDLNSYQMMFDILNSTWLILKIIWPLLLFFAIINSLPNLAKYIKDFYVRTQNERKAREFAERAKRAGVSDTDNMTGRQFEMWLKHYFERLGYNVHLLQGYKDKGADLILRKNGIKIAVQAKKRKSQNVRSVAIGDLLRAMRYYECSKGYLVTNQYFTQDAIDEVEDYDDIELWDRARLIEEIEKHRIRPALSASSGNKTKTVSAKKPAKPLSKPTNKGF